MSFIFLRMFKNEIKGKNMKQMKTLLLSGMTILALTACGSDQATVTNERNTTQLEENPNSTEPNGNNNTPTQQDTNTTNERNSTQVEENPNSTEINGDNNQAYIAPTEFTEDLLVGKYFYENEDANEDGILSKYEWLQIHFLSNTQLISAMDGVQHPITTYKIEEGKIFFTVVEDGETHIDIATLESANPLELKFSTTDGDFPTWTFEVPLKEKLLLGKTFSMKSNNIDYTVNYDNNHILKISSTEKNSEGTYEVKDGILHYTINNEKHTQRLIKVTKEGNLLMWDVNKLKVIWYYLAK